MVPHGSPNTCSWGYLVGLINRFGLRLELAASSKQWLEIGAFLDDVPWQQQRHGYGRWSEDEKRAVWDYLEEQVEYGPPTATLWRKASERFRRSPSSIKGFWRSWNDPRYAPPEVLNLKHERGLIKEMVETAMAKLGEATSSELIGFLRKNPEIQKTYGDRLQKHITKINGNKNSIVAWERTVRTNVDRYFDVTGRKRDGRVVYKPKKYFRLVIEIWCVLMYSNSCKWFFRLCILDVEIDEGHEGWKIWKKELVAFWVWNCIWIFKDSLTRTFVLCFVCIRNFMRQCWWELVVVAGSLVTFFGVKFSPVARQAEMISHRKAVWLLNDFEEQI